MRIYRCTRLEDATERFTLGKEYVARMEEGLLDLLVGDNNAWHAINPANPRFIISNSPVPNLDRYRCVPKYAHFEVIERQEP